MKDEIKRLDGLTNAEGEVMDNLIAAWKAYAKLPCQHPDELRDFADPIHRLQDLLTIRIARREYPNGWSIK